MKTSELTGPALDWAVAEASGTPIYRSGKTLTRMDMDGNNYWGPSTNWAQGGPIIEREGISMACKPKDARGLWHAVLGPNRFLSPAHEGFGPTPLIAAMRCYVASKLGDEIEIPAELS